MLRKTVPVITLLLLLFAAGCSSDSKNRKPDPFIKQEKMAGILTDLYLADGLLNIPSVREDFFMKDTIEAYMEILQGYGYSKEEFENNINYYFLWDQKRFQWIYDRVLANLSGMQAENSARRTEEHDAMENLWNGKAAYRLPDDAITDPVEFSVEITQTGIYSLKARATIFEDDQSEELSAYIYFWYDDGTETGYVEEWDRYYYLKNGRSEYISLRKVLENPRVTHIKGRLLDHSDKSGHWEMHSTISGINLTREEETEKRPAGSNLE